MSILSIIFDTGFWLTGWLGHCTNIWHGQHYWARKEHMFLLSLPLTCPVVFSLTCLQLYSNFCNIHPCAPWCAAPSFNRYDWHIWFFFLKIPVKVMFFPFSQPSRIHLQLENVPIIFFPWLTLYLSSPFHFSCPSPPASLSPSIRPNTVSPLLPRSILSLISLAFSAPSSLLPSIHPSLLSPSCCPSL